MKNIYIAFSKVFGILVVFGALLAPIANVAAQTVPADVAITVSPGAVCSGGSVHLQWTSSNAEVSISPGIGSVDPYGGITLHPTQNTTYTITGTNSTGGHGQATARVNIISGCDDDDEDGPSVSIRADDTSLDMDDRTVVRWDSDNATTCSASGGTNGWSGPKGLSGSFNTGSLDEDETYTITCTNSSGSSTDSVRINVDDDDDGDEPTVDLRADKTSVSYNDSTTLRWDSDDADTCRATNGTNGWSGKKSRSGTFNTGRLTQTTTFKIECENDEGEDDDSVTVRVGNDINVDNDRGPSVATDPATGVTGYSAVLNGRVNGNGLSTTSWFTYGTNPNFGYNTTSRSTGSGFTTYNSQVAGLAPNTTYYFRAVAQNSEGTVYGNTLAFTTPSGGGQTIITRTPANSLVLIDSSVNRSQPIVPTIDNSLPRPGDEIVYTVTYQNIGNASITNLVLRLNLPSEVDYMFSTPSNPTIAGDTLIFNLGTLRANGQGTVTARVRVRDNIPLGTDLEFPAVLTYIDPSGQPQSVAATVSAEVWSEGSLFGANAFWAGSFFPGNILELLFVIMLLAILILLVRRLMFPPLPTREVHTYTTTDNHDHH